MHRLGTYGASELANADPLVPLPIEAAPVTRAKGVIDGRRGASTAIGARLEVSPPSVLVKTTACLSSSCLPALGSSRRAPVLVAIIEMLFQVVFRVRLHSASTARPQRNDMVRRKTQNRVMPSQRLFQFAAVRRKPAFSAFQPSQTRTKSSKRAPPTQGAHGSFYYG